ncbi:unnamed protein product [Chironomus riparius]|uniref:Dol-P-Glc:Glc(2)Man(9)GlcNAc(2)-PP-Dol alpha-1,2-glucosyltransferase n=1 Tax=Chironomus riparius TaxID=315576 RepID=A0A9N9RPD5_9DIPT|nr:unnamed protein product [Chironomus riparius]
MERSWFKYRILLIYTIISVVILNGIYDVSKSVIDELFHVEQGLNYCYGFFQEWNPKITTLPGLYLLTLLTPRCSLYNLRMIPLVCSVINFYLIYGIRLMLIDDKNDRGRLKVLIDTMSIATLPPLYFFSFVYYTDVPSMTSILLTFYFALKEKYQLSSIFGLFSFLMRQTNIVWVAGIFGTSVINDMMKEIYPKIKLEESTFSQLLFSIKTHLKQPRMLFKLIGQTIKKYYGYILVIIKFLIFLVKNGSLVVGDKTAHPATLHLSQALYFSLFTLIFGFSLWFHNIWSFIKQIRNKRFVISIISIAILMALIIRYNTIVHPYLLADNRHYTFYVWNRLYGRNEYMRYLLIPVYIFGMYVICKSLHGSIGFKLFYIISTLLTFCLQGLVEVRYFLIPFVILRLFRKDVVKKWTFIEFLINVFLNYVTIKIFHTIQIKWPDFDEPQRIIW